MCVDKIWVFLIQDGVYGGVIVADSEEDARKKLSQYKGVNMPKEFTSIFSLASLDMRKDVHELW